MLVKSDVCHNYLVNVNSSTLQNAACVITCVALKREDPLPHSTRWLALGYFTYFFSYGIFLPFWSVWLEGLGLTPETIGLLLGAGLIARFLGSLLIALRDPSLV